MTKAAFHGCSEEYLIRKIWQTSDKNDCDGYLF